MDDHRERSIRGYRFDESQVVCDECISEEELAGLEGHEILTDTDIDEADEYYYCDRCASKLLPG